MAPLAYEFLHSRPHMAVLARCKATSELEHAVSSDRQGPVKPSVKDILPEPIERRFPLALYARDVTPREIRLGVAIAITVVTPPNATNTPVTFSWH